eukprot:scaffold178049_cov18-Tisochrysis_lutea.AAC.1
MLLECQQSWSRLVPAYLGGSINTILNPAGVCGANIDTRLAQVQPGFPASAGQDDQLAAAPSSQLPAQAKGAAGAARG